MWLKAPGKAPGPPGKLGCEGVSPHSALPRPASQHQQGDLGRLSL